MRLTRRLTITKATIASVTGAGLLSLVVTSALALPKPAATGAPTTAAAHDETPPPPPEFTEKPDQTTTNRNAQFKIVDAEAGVTFSCSLDGAASEPCNRVVNFTNLDFDKHCLRVRAVDAAGNQSETAATWCWSIVLHGGFPVSGTIPQLFAPGVSHRLDLVIGNPYNFPIRVTAVTITVAEDAATPCEERVNLIVEEPLAGPVDVPRNSTQSLSQLGVASADRPLLTMPNLSTNQDACKGASFSLTYTGEAIKP